MKKFFETKRREITLMIIVFMVLILFSMKNSQAKALSVSNIDIYGTIAEPIIVMESSESLKITNTNNSGVYNFKVKNYNEKGKITDVEVKYYIEILGNKNDDIFIKLKKEENDIEINNGKSQIFSMGKDNKEEHNYNLEIVYDKTKMNKEILQDIQIKILAYQSENKT